MGGRVSRAAVEVRRPTTRPPWGLRTGGGEVPVDRVRLASAPMPRAGERRADATADAFGIRRGHTSAAAMAAAVDAPIPSHFGVDAGTALLRALDRLSSSNTPAPALGTNPAAVALMGRRCALGRIVEACGTSTRMASKPAQI